MSLTSKLSCREVKLVNLNVFRAFPAIVLGICIGEAIVLGTLRDWIGITVVAVTVGCSLACVLRSVRPEQFWGVILVVVVGVSISTAYLALVIFDERILPAETFNRPNLNGTSCDDGGLDNRTATICHEMWVEDVKSGISLWISNVGLIINTVLIRPPSLEST